MNIERRPIDSITPYDQNPRVNDGAVDAVAASLKEFGFRQPIVVDQDGVIVVGHTRWKAAKKLGLTQVPVHVATELTPAQARAYRIADNATAAIAEWDHDLLPVEIAALDDAGFDVDLLGFSDERLAEILAPKGNPGLCDPDEVPEPPDEAETKPGDLWVLGEHRLLCGNSGDAADVDRLLDGAPIHLAHCDPPYNVNVEPSSAGSDTGPQGSGKRPQRKPPSWRSIEAQRARGVKPPAQNPRPVAKTAAKGRRLAGDFVSGEEFDRLLLAWFGNIARVLRPGRAFYLWGGYVNIANYPGALRASGLYFSQCVIWHKMHPVISRKDFMGDHEWAFYGWREGRAHEFFGPNNVPDVWSVKKVSPQKMEHLTQKPVELAARAMAYSSKAGENVLDLFGGSGSTLIAAEQQGRRAFLMEIDPLYCDLIVNRWQRYSGRAAVLQRTGDSPIPVGAREEAMR